MRRTSLLLGLCLFLAAFGTSKASSSKIKAWFPDHPSLEFLPGKTGVAVIGIKNTGSTPFNVTAAFANLALVSAPEGNVYNFSGLGYKVPQLAAGEETTVEYQMFFPSNLPPRDFFLHLRVMLTEGQMPSYNLIFNETISIIEGHKIIDTELLGLYAILLAGLAAGAYALYNLAVSKGLVKKTKKARTTGTAAGAGDRNEWLKGTVADKSKKSAAGKQS